MTNLRNISNSTLQRQLAQLAKMGKSQSKTSIVFKPFLEARMPQLLAVLFSFENAPMSSSDINFENLTT